MTPMTPELEKALEAWHLDLLYCGSRTQYEHDLSHAYYAAKEQPSRTGEEALRAKLKVLVAEWRIAADSEAMEYAAIGVAGNLIRCADDLERALDALEKK